MKKYQERIYTQDQLQTICEEYQELLELSSWEIEIKMVKQSSIPDVFGQITYSPSRQQAVIEVPSPGTYEPGDLDSPQDMIMCLLHELVHLIFCQADRWFADNQIKTDLFEASIEKMARTLCGLLPEPEQEAKTQ